MFGNAGTAQRALARAEQAEEQVRVLERRVDELEGKHVVHQNRLATLALRDHQDDRLASHIATTNVLIDGLNKAVARLQGVLLDAADVLAAREVAKEEFRKGLQEAATMLRPDMRAEGF